MNFFKAELFLELMPGGGRLSALMSVEFQPRLCFTGEILPESDAVNATIA